MVGGDPFKDKAVMHVTETPWSLPSFVTDVGALFMETIRASASEYAQGGGSPEEAIVETRMSEGGTRNEFIADVTPFDTGSDHDDYDSSEIAVPSLYLRDWPDTYIHTDHDSLDQMDATKLRRVAAMGAAAGYVYASLDAAQLPVLLPFFTAQSEVRVAKAFAKAQRWAGNPQMAADVAWYEARNLMTRAVERECEVLRSLVVFSGGAVGAEAEGVKALRAQAAVFDGWIDAQAKAAVSPWMKEAGARRVAVRIAPFGPVQNQNDNALLARLGKERYGRIKLLNGDANRYVNLLDTSGLYAYEILNFVNGKRTVGEIRDAVAAEYGPIGVDVVADYLAALAEAKIIEWSA
jgi:hypothetical protein